MNSTPAAIPVRCVQCCDKPQILWLSLKIIPTNWNDLTGKFYKTAGQVYIGKPIFWKATLTGLKKRKLNYGTQLAHNGQVLLQVWNSLLVLPGTAAQ